MKALSSASSVKWQKRYCVLILVATIAAIALRLPRLQLRPMHGDEAVHAEKFRLLLEQGDYSYDPNEYHGPTLNYLTLIPAWLSSAKKLPDVSEFTLRIVPVFFGVLLVLLLLPLTDGLGPTTTACAAVLTAISPAFVFYSRYYIHEMLLVCFTFGAITFGYRYTQSKNLKWALLTGIFLGLCHATKETCIIVFGSMLLALLFTLLMKRRQHTFHNSAGTVEAIKAWHCIAAAAAAAIVSALFYSSFLTNAQGIADSFRTYTYYFTRASQNQWHTHPWYYYLKMLIYSRYGTGPAWSEGLIVLLAAAGFIVAMTRKGLCAVNRELTTDYADKIKNKTPKSVKSVKSVVKKQLSGVDFHLLRFIAFYTAIMTVLYSAIPYKTPWCMLGFLHGMILLAAVGAAAVIKLAPNVLARVVVSLLLVASGAHLAWQAYLGSYKYYADPANPYVYAHPTTDVFAITERVEEIAQVHPDGREMQIQVIYPADDYWPLPWYFRSFANVWWWNKIDERIMPAPVIIASPSVEPDLVRFFDLPPPGEKNLYLPLFDTYIELRPQVELRGYVTKDLWDRYQQHQAQLMSSQTEGKK